MACTEEQDTATYITPPHIKKYLKKKDNIRIKFNLNKLKDPNIVEHFQAVVGGRFAPLLALDSQDMEVDDITNNFNKVITETANDILGKHRPVKKPWVNEEVLKLCDKRRELKQRKNEIEGARQYREANQQVRKSMKQAKESWIAEQCQDIEESLQSNNSKKAFQLVKGLTSMKRE